MKVDSISHSNSQAGVKHALTAEQSIGSRAAKKVEARSLESSSVTTTNNSTVVNASEVLSEPKGVIRNLLEGHYRGVSDVRLRINFFDQLQSLNLEAGHETAQNELTSLLNEANLEFETLLSADVLSENQTSALIKLQQDFALALDELINRYSNNAAVEKSGFETDLSQIFNTLKDSLNSLFVAPELEVTVLAEESPAELTTAASATSEAEVEVDTAPSPIEVFTDNMLTMLSSGFDSIRNAITSTNLLPELSPPNGNGRAYQKFMAIYNELQSAAAPTPQLPEMPIETLA